MTSLCDALTKLPEVEEILKRLRDGGCPVAVGGLSAVHKAHLAAALHHATGRPVVMLCPDEQEATKLCSDVSVLSREDALYFRERDFSFYPSETVSREWEQARIPVLHRMLSGTAPFVIGAIDAFMQRTLPPEILKAQEITLKEGMEIAPESLIEGFVKSGYKRCDVVEGVGQFARRGGIIDFFAPGNQEPIRIEFFGDEIDTISTIDPSTQRRGQRLTVAHVYPCSETLAHTAPDGLEGLIAAIPNEDDAAKLRDTGYLSAIDKYMALISPEMYTALDYIPRRAIIILSETTRLSERVKNTLWQREQDIETLLEQNILTSKTAILGEDDVGLWSSLEAHDLIWADSFLPSQYPVRPHSLQNIMAKQLPSYGASLETALSDIAHYKKISHSVIVLTPDERRTKHLDEILRERGVSCSLDSLLSELPKAGEIAIAVGALSAGMEYPSIGLAILTEGQASPERVRKKFHSSVKTSNRKRISSYTDLTPGDLVVHEHHGIGRFAGITPMQVDGVTKDYIKLCYSGTDVLFVSVTQLNLVSKYIGAHAESEDGKGGPKLSKLGGTDWNKAKSRAKAAAKELAKGLIELYASRKRLTGFSFPEDSDWQMSFEEKFEYQETDDQLRCIAEIKQDMQSDYPMDRLLCGDVGFGKTEVALRAVMKCILGGKQSAILVPTTVLAQQHFLTATRRFAGYPVRIEVLSRFRSAAQIKDSIKKIHLGQVDLVIGTHRLIQKDVRFKNLGLLIIDEEQRFGVTHKERLKEMSRQVDVLTLTATPIPRTLNMAMSGIRDLSTIEEAPRDRYPVQTFVLEHDWSVLADAVRREVSRGGQVFFLHNRVETIERTASKIQSLVDGVSVAVAHGKMNEDELAEVMRSVSENEVQVLVCTTIIETGIDIPNANTLIIEDADRLGLAQLHQIRGRVGRSSRHAYAFLTFRRGKILTEVATRRLSAIREFAEFGSGFKIAMRDLEIRGAGNVLGAEQSGHLMSVGYDMYLKLLEEAVIEEKGGAPDTVVECTADLPVTAGIDQKYIAHAGIRMDFYRRIAAIMVESDAEDMRDELIDRFGELPESVNTLIRIARLRYEAGKIGITDISQKGGRLNFKLPNPDFAKVSLICAKPEYKGRILFSMGDIPYVSIKLQSGQSILDAAVQAVASFA